MTAIQAVSAAGNFLDSLIGTTSYASGSTMSYYFGSSTDTFYGSGIFPGGVTGTQVAYTFTTEGHRAYASAGEVTSLSFVQTFTQTSADLSLYGATSLQSGGGLNGFHFFPGLHNKGGGNFAAYGVIDHSNSNMAPNPDMAGDTAHRSRTIIHELGHGLGLGHPQDTGNGSTTAISGTTLDSELYTVMSYNRWYSSAGFNNDGTFFGYGHAASYMALDIAALQHMYGADMTTYTGATSYTLFDKGVAALDTDGSDGTIGVGRSLYSIWDAGGTDTISYGGSSRTILNLNDATLNTNPATQSADLLALLSEINDSGVLAGINASVVSRMTNASAFAGGFFSHILNDNGTVQAGGFSIANGAIVENATGGSGNDILIGNEQTNVLTGNNGNDNLFGGAATDYLIGGAGNDNLYGGAGADILSYGSGNDHFDGGSGIDYVSYASGPVSPGTNLRIDLIMPGSQTGLAAGHTYHDVEAFFLSQGNDLFSGDTNNNFIFGQDGADAIAGNGGGDIIFGEGGNDWILSGALADIVVGGDGLDTFVYMTNQIEQDQILDFAVGVDKLNFDDIGFNLVGQNIYAGINFLSTTLGLGTIYAPGQSMFIYYSDLGLLYADTDGAGGMAPNLIAAFAGLPGLTPNDIMVV